MTFIVCYGGRILPRSAKRVVNVAQPQTRRAAGNRGPYLASLRILHEQTTMVRH